MFLLRLQEFIHSIEEGAGSRILRLIVAIVAFLGLAVMYDMKCYRNLATSEAMDTAQLGRNIAEGKGFTTLYIRPFSIYLLKKHRDDQSSLMKGDHPDLANAPLFPTLLAGVFKFVPAQDMSAVKDFSHARDDVVIAIFNQFLLFTATLLVYWLGKRWFDRPVAILAAVLFALTELYWRMSITGLSTLLLLNLVLLLGVCLTSLERATNDGRSTAALIFRGAMMGLVVGVACLTRYAAGWLILPVIGYLMLFANRSRGATIAAAVATFLIVLAPWVTRNMVVSGTPFGIAGFAALEQTANFPDDRLHRSLQPSLELGHPVLYLRKLIVNLRDVVKVDWLRMNGNWMSCLFLAGLLVPFRNPALSRFRWFVVFCLVVFTVIQPLGKTQLWTEAEELSSENLLGLISPLVLIFACGVFFVLIDGIPFPSIRWRFAAIGGFGTVVSLPLLLGLLPPNPFPLVYPPYYPPRIQQLSGLLKETELMMSDIPWAVAWYGRRQSVLFTADSREEFFRINDFEKPINGLYLTTRTTEKPTLSAWMSGNRDTWEGFLTDALVRQQLPGSFPLRRAPDGLVREGQLLLMDYERWKIRSK